ncbi:MULTISPECIES: transcriptional regulator LldR [unclassified Serratia (in: enterobacteria)]|uniref:transcriptional regulator LldR n=1 Tax=unclassified Serratia (in: enterobacteria) TaxID=2647522 RepID=UPI00046A632B|nr:MULTISPECIES: transcriptional regulator LldR [unclassified Serratia (in: enterobacteria)]
MTDKLQPARLADQLVERIKHMIHERQLVEGMRLPAERQLANEMGVSRSSLREAIQKLISEKTLISRRGGGTYVCDEFSWSQHSIVEPLRTLVADDPGYRYDILEARHAIEASTAWHAAMRATAADKEKLQACFDATLALKESDHPDLAAQADVRFHLAIAEASHNVVLLQTMRGFFDLMQSSVMHSRQRMYTLPTIFTRLTEQHEELLLAILAGDPERAGKAAKSHLGFVHSTIKNLHEDEARQARITRLPDENSL